MTDDTAYVTDDPVDAGPFRVGRRSGTVDGSSVALEAFEIDPEIDRRASSIGPSSLRTLDAIHIATALALPGVDAFITYDDRQAEAARLVGLPVIRPG